MFYFKQCKRRHLNNQDSDFRIILFCLVDLISNLLMQSKIKYPRYTVFFSLIGVTYVHLQLLTTHVRSTQKYSSKVLNWKKQWPFQLRMMDTAIQFIQGAPDWKLLFQESKIIIVALFGFKHFWKKYFRPPYISASLTPPSLPRENKSTLFLNGQRLLSCFFLVLFSAGEIHLILLLYLIVFVPVFDNRNKYQIFLCIGKIQNHRFTDLLWISYSFSLFVNPTYFKRFYGE